MVIPVEIGDGERHRGLGVMASRATQERLHTVVLPLSSQVSSTRRLEIKCRTKTGFKVEVNLRVEHTRLDLKLLLIVDVSLATIVKVSISVVLIGVTRRTCYVTHSHRASITRDYLNIE